MILLLLLGVDGLAILRLLGMGGSLGRVGIGRCLGIGGAVVVVP